MPDVYRNLTRRCWSVRVKNRVVDHVSALVLRDVSFVVSLPGVARVRARGQREVIGFARGIPVQSGSLAGALRVRFDPYLSTDFTLPDGALIRAAAVVCILPDGSCWAVLPSPGDPSCVA